MKREFITNLVPDISKEDLDKIMAEHGKTVESHKAVTTAKENELATANQTIKDLQDTVKRFDGVDVAALNKQIADLQAKYDTDLSTAKLNGALEAALMGAKAKNTKAVRALLNMDEIKMDGEKLLGIDSQLEKLKTDSGYLFDGADSTQTTTVSTGGQHGGALEGDLDTFTAAAMQGAGIASQK